ncbi:hypothetical protein N8482_00080 [Chitinophagales bacterium]|nr:hypothetical protein [Chitinophagales bacterium]
MRNLFLFSLIALAFFVFPSCEKEGLNNGGDDPLAAPSLPPVEIHEMPVNEIAEAENTMEDPTGEISYSHWIHSGVNVAVWNTVITLNMAVPIAAFKTALNGQGSFIGDNTFQWNYNYTAPLNLGGKTYQIVLTGQYINNFQDVLWTMSASQAGAFSNFVWYTGVVSVNHNSSEFTLYSRPNNPEETVSVSFERNGSDASLRFTNIVPNNAANGQYIEYRSTTDGSFNRAFDLQLEAGNLLEIEWNAPENDGRVRHESHFADSEWHCWNSAKINVNCN